MRKKSEERKKLYYSLNSKLVEYSSQQLMKLVSDGQISEGWGENSTIKISGHKIFVKSVPLTQKEFDHSFNTKNLYRLPLFYNYGVGSAGFGAFRELSCHIKTTNWVLSDEHHNFPLLYHYLIIPNLNNKKSLKPVDPKEYIKSWNGSKNIERYITERKKSQYQIVLFLEHIPFTLSSWMRKKSGHINQFSKKIYKTLDFLNKQKIIHFDAHWDNLLTDGHEVYLTDFGLCLNYSHCSTQKEKTFFKEHQYYDHAEYIGCMSMLIEEQYRGMTLKNKKILAKKFDIQINTSPIDRINLIIKNLDSIVAHNHMSFEKSYLAFIQKHKKTIISSNTFFKNIGLKKKSTKLYSAKKIRKSLKEESVIK